MAKTKAIQRIKSPYQRTRVEGGTINGWNIANGDAIWRVPPLRKRTVCSGRDDGGKKM